MPYLSSLALNTTEASVQTFTRLPQSPEKSSLIGGLILQSECRRHSAAEAEACGHVPRKNE